MRGWGRNLGPAETGDEMGASSLGGGVTLTLGDETIRGTEGPRLQEETESDFEGTTLGLGLFEAGLPREVPPLMTVVDDEEVEMWPSTKSSCWWAWPLRLTERLPNLPPRAAVIGTWSGEVLRTPSWDLR